MNKLFLRKLTERLTGYWFHKIKDLPIGTDLRIDITERFKYKNVSLIFDVGANSGQTYNQFKHMFPASTIFCFEPIDSTFKKLIKNIPQNKNTIAENFAFGEVAEERTVRLYVELDGLNSLNEEAMNPSQDAKTQVVKVDTIDNYCKRKNIGVIDLLKIDTEGYELNILRGATGLLEGQNISFIYAEVGFLQKNKRHTNFSALSEFLALYDYYFIGMYNGSSDDWREGFYYGNALFGHINLDMGNFA